MYITSGVTNCNVYSVKQHSGRKSMKGVYLLLASIAVLAISTGSDAAPDPNPIFWPRFWYPHRHHHRRPSTTTVTSTATSAAPASTASSASATSSTASSPATATAAPAGR